MPRTLLVIEDSNEDFQVILRSLERAQADVTVTRALDGDDALDMLREAAGGPVSGMLPSVILLDLNLPGTDGREILTEIKGDELLKMIPIIVLSTSTNPRDIVDCYRNGASGYCVKPVDRFRFEETIKSINDYWLKHVTLPERAYLQ